MKTPALDDEQDWLDHTLAFLKRRPYVWIPPLIAVILAVVLVTKPFAASPPVGTDPTVAGRPLSNPDQHLHSLAIDPNATGVVYLGSHYGLFGSSDDGKSWPQKRGELNDLMIISLAVSPMAHGALGLIGIEPNGGDFGSNGVYITHDNGAHWLRAADPPGLGQDPSRYLIAPGLASVNQWFVIYNGAGLYVTDNNGQSWRLLRAPASPQEAQRAVWQSAAQPQTILLGSNTSLQITHDGGATWAPVAALQTGVHAIVASAAAPNTIYVAADSGLFRSDDGGASWAQVSVNVAAAPFTTLAVSPQHANVLYGLIGATIWRSADGGANWTQTQSLATTLPCPELFVARDSDNHLYAGSYSPAVAEESRDGGQSWQVIAS